MVMWSRSDWPQVVPLLSDMFIASLCLSLVMILLILGIYPAASMMNHSCIPLIVNSFSGSCLTVRVLRNVSVEIINDELIVD